MAWLTIDEQADSINAGFFVVSLDPPNWGPNIPGSYHNGGCIFSFADGHAEIHRWKSSTSIYKVYYHNNVPDFVTGFDAAGVADYQWCKERTGFTPF
jgi:prepilin-type processing-associated H-X9-DG protein